MKVVTPGHGTDDHRAQSDTRFSRHHDSKKEDSVCADELLWDRAPHDASHSRMRVRDRRHLSRHVRRKVASSLAMHHSHTHSRALVTCPSGSDAGPHPSPRRASSSSYRHIYSSSRHPPERPATRHRATCSSHGVGRGIQNRSCQDFSREGSSASQQTALLQRLQNPPAVSLDKPCRQGKHTYQ